jgi:hypothetical protein
MLDLVRLLDLDTDADRVDARLDQDALVLIARYRQRAQHYLGRRLGFDFGNIMPFGGLRGKVRQV